MAKRHRGRTRVRREAPQRHAVAPERVEHVEREPAPRPLHRPTRGPVRASRTGFARASGTPSAALERAALAERAFVTKDFRRVGIVVAVCLALLVVSGFVEKMLVR